VKVVISKGMIVVTSAHYIETSHGWQNRYRLYADYRQ
jgi:hypothetical protein